VRCELAVFKPPALARGRHNKPWGIVLCFDGVDRIGVIDRDRRRSCANVPLAPIRSAAVSSLPLSSCTRISRASP
jgi:hypothetical protein